MHLMDDPIDELVNVLPIHYSNGHVPKIQIHQFPLLTRPLQAPPSAILSGKPISARIKPNVRRLEVHVPVDSRPEVWNIERTKELGAARAEDDREKNQESKGKEREGEEPRLSEIRMRSEEIPQRGVHMLGIVRAGTPDLSK
jgi:DNA-directed RNA polymerase-3 subunit RPC5